MKKLIPLIIFILMLEVNLLAEDALDKNQSPLSLLIIEAMEGNPKSQYELAKLYDTGYESIPVDSGISTSLYLKAAHQNYAPAMNYIGYRYYKGEYLKQNMDSAIFWIKKAAESGDITAAANLAFLLTEIPDTNSVENDDEIHKWMLIAAEAGLIEPQYKVIAMDQRHWRDLPIDSAFVLGIKYYTGRAPIMGVELIKIAAEARIPRALALMGDAYSKGRGLSYDYTKSSEYFLEAAYEGDPSAQFIIAEQLDFFPDSFKEISIFKNLAQDAKTAAYWYEKAAEGGVFDAESAYTRLISSP